MKKKRRRSLGIFWASNKIYKLDKIFFLSFYFFTSSLSRANTAMTRWNCFRPGILITKFNDCKNSLFFRHWISPFYYYYFLGFFFHMYIYILLSFDHHRRLPSIRARKNTKTFSKTSLTCNSISVLNSNLILSKLMQKN